MERVAPPAPELPPFPIELTLATRWRIASWGMTLGCLGMAIWLTLDAMRVVAPRPIGLRVATLLAVAALVVLAIAVHGSRLTLHADRIEEVNGWLFRRVLPLETLHSFRFGQLSGVALVQLLDERGKTRATLGLGYDHAEWLVVYLASRLVDAHFRDAEREAMAFEALRAEALVAGDDAPDARAIHGLGRIALGAIVAVAMAPPVTSVLRLRVPGLSDLMRLLLCVLLVVIATARYRWRRFSGVGELLAPLRVGQLIACWVFGLTFLESRFEIVDVRLAAALVVVAALPIAWAELALDRHHARSRWSRIGTVPLAMLMAGMPLMDLNARFPLGAPEHFEVVVTDVHCSGRSHLHVRVLDGAESKSLQVPYDTCARTKVGGRLKGERVRGLLGVRVSRILRPWL